MYPTDAESRLLAATDHMKHIADGDDNETMARVLELGDALPLALA